MEKQIYEILEGFGWFGIIMIAFIIAATLETGKANRRRELERENSSSDTTTNPHTTNSSHTN